MRLALLSSVFAISGCFLGYDSSWGATKTAQKHNAEAARPASFAKAESAGGVTKKASRTFYIRVYATPQFASQTVDWKHDFKETLATANEILTAAADMRLEIATLETWPSPPAEDGLPASLNALQKLDSGEKSEWIVGLVGSFAKFTTNFHDLGLAEQPGRRLVLRAAGDVTEHEAAEAAFDQLSPEERLAVLGERRRHRSVATFVHEIGHTLGAVHDDTKEGLMHPFYSKHMRAFGPEVAKLLAIGAAHRTDPNQRAWAEEALTFYKKSATPWVDKERNALIATLETYVAPTAAVSAAPVAFAEMPTELAEKHKPAWTSAVESYRANKLKEAWDAGTPLFTAYPKVYAVQDFRCQIAMKIGFAWERTKLECEQLMKLSTGK